MRRRLRTWKDALYGSWLERATRYATFTSETGYALPLYRLHRYLAIPRLAHEALSLRSGARASGDPEAARLLALLDAHLGDTRELDYLEVGVGHAAKAEGFAAARFRSRTCTDLRAYYDERGAPAQEERFRGSGIRFVWDDFVATALPEKGYDVIACFDVLEHVCDSARFVANAAARLRDGGVLYASYNPFFAINGGHSAAITDAHWGHALLTRADLERYFRLHDPRRAERALRFLDGALNRLSLGELARLLRANGFETLELRRDALARPDLVDAAMREQLARVHPQATPDDLLTRQVRFLARRVRAAS
jgi:SAM-dependent methyltransferase